MVVTVLRRVLQMGRCNGDFAAGMLEPHFSLGIQPIRAVTVRPWHQAYCENGYPHVLRCLPAWCLG